MKVRAFVLVCAILSLACSWQTTEAQTPAEQKREPAGGRLLDRLRNRGPGEKPGEASAKKSPLRQDVGKLIEIAGLRVSVWEPPSDVPGPLPLVVFSHGFHGISTQSTFLTKALADNGYLVLAPNHKDSVDSGEFKLRPDVGFIKAGDWSDATHRDRGEDIQLLLRTIKRDKEWDGVIDWTKVALAGHSLGGYTSLGLAGAWPSWKTDGIKAVLALSPYCSPYLKNGKLGAIDVPVMYQGGTKDIGITPFVKRNGGAYDVTKGPAYFVEFSDAGHFAWTDLKDDFQESITYYSLAFLDKHVKGDSKAAITKKRSDVADLRVK
jgi:predicted dienelactone hydrolase